jgi:thiamine-monophosphate kinase
MPLKEKLIIDRIRRAALRGRRGQAGGIGDDCAVLQLPRGHEALITTDFSLEEVHFRRVWHPAEAVGHRCLARGLSDIAAMGGIPRATFLSLAVPADLLQGWIDGFIRGLLHLADSCDVLLAGGDTAQSPGGILADVVVLGSVPTGQAVLRSGAKPGDLLYVTGTIGSSVAALHALQAGKKLRPGSHRKHFYPEPRIAVGQYLREKKLASAMVDISDGLSTDLGHICAESGTGAVVYADSLPAAIGQDGLALALHGGDEYELLFTAPSKRQVPREIAGVPVSLIGEIVRGKQVKLAKSDGKTEILKPGGWQHFA